MARGLVRYLTDIGLLTGKDAKHAENQHLQNLSTAASCAMSWKSKQQSAFATSTTEAEHLALGMAAQESTWIGRMFTADTETERSPKKSQLIDDQSAIEMAKMMRVGLERSTLILNII